MDHMRLPSAYKSYMRASTPYTYTLAALKAKYSQPWQLVLSEIASILHSSPIRPGDNNVFQSFALSVHSLVGVLLSVEGAGGRELHCGSHLLNKMPLKYRSSFPEHCLVRVTLKEGSSLSVRIVTSGETF